MTDLLEQCCRAHATQRRALNHAPAFTDDEWSSLWSSDELRDGFRVPMRAVIATIGAGLTGEHVRTLNEQVLLDREDGLLSTAKVFDEIAAVIAAIVEANRHD